jgi:GH25 family lysozyme M1 (1,4-beta-N-acetylmuramidase)
MKKLIITLITLIIISVSIAITLKTMYKKNKLEIQLKQNEIEVYKDITLKELINNDINLINDYKIDTEQIGEQELEVQYKNKIFKYKEKIQVNIVDTEAPVILSKNITIEQGSDIDLVNSMLCGDNYDARPKCYVEGNYNINEVGTYNLKYIGVDTSNNKTEKTFTLNVIKKQPKQQRPTQESFIAFKDIVNLHKKANTRIGIDVSKWQGNIDFEAVKNAKAEFIMIKAGGSYIDGELYTDPYFITNIENALKNNLDVGVYFYSNANTIEQAQKEIDYVLDLIKDYDIKLGIAFDWENFTDFNTYNISFHTLNKMATKFLEETKNKGYKPLLYSSKYYLENIWNLNYDTWVAQYADNNTYQGDYVMWQQCSDGKIDGILGYVDIDIMYLK